LIDTVIRIIWLTTDIQLMTIRLIRVTIDRYQIRQVKLLPSSACDDDDMGFLGLFELLGFLITVRVFRVYCCDTKGPVD
jgi:hypothetical protein